jgi:hypothetical protein
MMNMGHMTPISAFLVAVLALAPAGAASAVSEEAEAEAEAKEAVKTVQEPQPEAIVRPSAAARKWTVTLQTGLAETFQLTLGGVFGDGPAWQSRVVLTRANAFRTGDSISITGFNTHDSPTHNNDWTAGISYRARLVNKRGHLLYATGGLERWRFPGVLSGAQDWIAAYSATYATRVGRTPVTVQSNAWTVLHSPLQDGSLVYTTAWFDHALMENGNFKLVLRHGPQHTYSWNFYGTNGHRVLRYAGALVRTQGRTSYEAGFRPQYGMQNRIPHNRYWHVMVSHTF